MRQSDFVAFSKKGSAVLMKLKHVVGADHVLTPEEGNLVRRGEAQIKWGDSKSWRDVRDALAR